jgi:hypothetical protein
MNRDTAIGLLRRTRFTYHRAKYFSKEEIDVTAGTDSHPNDPHVAALGRVRQVTLPPAARALSTLSHVDYEDAFLVETGQLRYFPAVPVALG